MHHSIKCVYIQCFLLFLLSCLISLNPRKHGRRSLQSCDMFAHPFVRSKRAFIDV